MKQEILRVISTLKWLKSSPTFLVTYHLRHDGKVIFAKGRITFFYIVRILSLITIMASTVTWLILEDRKISSMTTYIKLIRIFVAIRCLMLTFTQRDNLAKFLNKMYNMDIELEEKMAVIISYRSITSMIVCKVFIILIITVGNTALCLNLTKSVGKCSVHFGAYSIPYIVNSLTLLQFSIVTLAIWDRLKVLNGALTNFVIAARDQTETSAYLAKKLRYTSLTYNRIFDGTRLVNTIYSQQLSLTISRTIVEILNCLHTYIKGDNELLIYYDVFWAFIAVIELLLVLPPCSSARRYSKRTPQILNMLHAEGRSLEFEKNMFLLQMKHQKIKFTAGGFFPIDETILLTLVQATSSYLIILLQFAQFEA